MRNAVRRTQPKGANYQLQLLTETARFKRWYVGVRQKVQWF
jgi:hypothetical protein